MPARAPRAQQARRRVVRAAAAEEEAELRQPLGRVRVRRVVGQVPGVERQRRALERVAAARLALAGRHLRRQREHGRLRLAGDEPVEGRVWVVEVVRAHRDVVTAGGDHGVRQLPAHPLADRHGGGVLQGGPAGDDDQVRLPLGQQTVGDLQEALAGDVVARVAQLGLQIEHVRVVAGPAQLREQLDQLRLDARPVGPAPAEEGSGEHQQHARLLHLDSCDRGGRTAA